MICFSNNHFLLPKSYLKSNLINVFSSSNVPEDQILHLFSFCLIFSENLLWSPPWCSFILIFSCLPVSPIYQVSKKKWNQLYNVISSKVLNLTSSIFLQWFSMSWNCVLTDLMGLPQHTQIMQVFENWPVIIPKFTSKMVLSITSCKRIFWKDLSNIWTQKIVSTRR